MSKLYKVGFGGSCHWCTEAIFQSLVDVEKVEQGWISSLKPQDNFSEAVIVHFDVQRIDLIALIEIHLHTHSCTKQHSMRSKYRSAVYAFSNKQQDESFEILNALQTEFDEKIVTKVLPFQEFKSNQENYLNYYYSNPEKPFCQTYISPKLKFLLAKYGRFIKREKKIQ